jgi:Outer membrane protein beta-barrel domain
VKRAPRSVLVAMLLWLGTAPQARAQDDDRLYAGVLVGVSTLSADARASTQPSRAEVSLYKPENGSALNLFVGMHVGRYFTVQSNYVWNRNDLALFSSVTSMEGGRFYEQQRTSTQHAVIGDALLYFRALGSGIRPYLSTGAGLMRFRSESMGNGVAGGLPSPDGEIASTRLALRVAVGIDLEIGDQWSIRYSFSETISGNPISARLTPPGERNLANFQNLFGVIRRF